MEKHKKKILGKEKGITLIALVITIIVLLILAGVSIAMLTGQNGILTQAQNAKNRTEEAQVEEENRLNEYNNIINNYVSGVTTEETPTFDEDTLTIGEATNVDKYGWKVPNYTVQAGDMTTNVWRLFYQDSNYTYLITDECVGINKPSENYVDYISGADVSTIGQKLNPMLLANGKFFTSSNTDENILATAWLTDPNEWDEFKNGDAVFAIGSPTVELYVKSFNATAKIINIDATLIPELGVGEYGYTEGTVEDQLKTTYNNGIYNKSTSSDWLLSSPYYSSGEIFVKGKLGYFGSYEVTDTSYAVRPLVCIPTSVFNSKYLSSLVNEK